MMRRADKQNPSLWWQLSWQLSLVIVFVVAAVIVGICIWATTVVSPNVAKGETITRAIAAAVERRPQGGFRLRETPELGALKAMNSRLWYVAATTDGRSVSYGTVPEIYAGVAHLAHLFEDADIREIGRAHV